jgi:molecular chaperone IbpA
MTKQHYLTSLDIPAINRLGIGFDKIFQDFSKTIDTNTNYPPYNLIKYSDSEYVVEVAVAGFSESQIDVELHKRTLRVSGRSERTETEDTAIYLHRGISGRDFTRVFTLAENVNVTGAEVDRGVLRVHLVHEVPPEHQPKKIEIKFKA